MLDAIMLGFGFLAVAAYIVYTAFRGFDAHDDEGYMLIASMHYRAGLPLYTGMFAQYGPFHFFAQNALFRGLGLPITHDSGRIILSLLWLASAVLAAIFVYRRSHNFLLTCGAGFAMSLICQPFVSEPGHPQQIIVPLLILACCATTLSPVVGSLVLGAVAAGLLFTKINVSLFFLAALAAALVGGLSRSLFRRFSFALLFSYATLVPVMLARKQLADTPCSYLCIVTIVGSFTIATMSWAIQPDPNARRRIFSASIGFGATILLMTIGFALGNVSPRTLWQGVVVLPLRQAVVFHFPLAFNSTQVVESLLLLAVTLVTLAAVAFRTQLPVWVELLRFGAGLLVLFALILGPRTAPALLTLLPLALIPVRLGDGNESRQFAGAFIPIVSATQLLQTYPVAGSQVAVALTPVMVWCFLCLADALPTVGSFFSDTFSCSRLVIRNVAGGGTALILLVVMARDARRLHAESLPRATLFGMTHVHMEQQQAQILQHLADDLHHNCSMLYSLPGMLSFNAWSQTPTPDGFVMTAWIKGIPAAEQQHTLQILKRDSEACVVVNAGLEGFWQVTPQDIRNSPLATYMVSRMRPVESLGGYEIRVQPDRIIRWESIAR